METPSASLEIVSASEGTCASVTPADQALAVGAASGSAPGVLQAINPCLLVYDKTGALKPGYPKSFTSFVGLPATAATTDPRAFYDWVNHRYILTFIQFDSSFNSASSYWIAVSTADNPTGTFCVYNLAVQSVTPNGPGTFPIPDFPRLGQDRQAIYIASNLFVGPSTSPAYKWEEILMLPKAQMYACNSFSFSTFSGLSFMGTLTDSTQPANIYSAGDDPRSEYLVTSKNFSFPDPKNGLIVWAIHGPLTASPTLTNVGVATQNNYSIPPLAAQPGFTNPAIIDPSDSRISGMVYYAAGSLYASLTTTGPGPAPAQPACVLYQIQPFVNLDGTINSARMLNEIILSDMTNSWYYCTQQPDPEGNVTTVFNISGATKYPSLGYASRRAAQPTGTLPDTGFILQAGSGPAYAQPPGCSSTTPCRWGDYTAVAPAGLVSAGGTGGFPRMWFAGMYATGGIWGTAIGYNDFFDISQP